MAGAIVAAPLIPPRGFNWVYLLELLICSILTVFFLFYFNRLFATLVSYAIRAYTWRAYRTYIDIQALQISLLGGRIFFKDIRYHGHNETILVHNGYITWNYWLRRVRDAELYSADLPPPTDAATTDEASSSAPSGSRSRNLDKAEKGGKSTQKRLPCRFSVKISGVEAFLYNRTPAYDGIVDAIRSKANSAATEETAPSDHESTRTGQNVLFRTSTELSEDQRQQMNKLRKAPAKEEGMARPGTDTTNDSKTDGLPAFLKLLPVHVECNKGAIVIGNEHTESVITAQFEKATGDFDAAPSSPLDAYQQVFNFQVTHPIVHMKPNPDYKSPQLEAARRLKQEEQQDVLEQEEMEEKHKQRSFRLPRLPKLFSRSTDSIHTHHGGTTGRASMFAPQWHFPGQDKWKGLSRYMDDDQTDGHGEWDGVEYAKTSLIADCPCVNVSFYWDVAGKVPTLLDNSMYTEPTHSGDINGSAPPEYGVHIQVYGGTVSYGPWTDRHRGIFQSFFFPGAHVDAEPASPLKPGDTRVLTVFKLYLSIEDETVLRIPIREPSKDWKWKGKAKTLGGQDKEASDKSKGRTRSRKKYGRTKQRDAAAPGQNVRPFGWIDVKVAGNSSVNYVMDMVASQHGFTNKLDVDIAGAEITSSVNHGLLWRSGAIGLDCDLSNPLSWNSLRKWKFNISCRDLELFLLRDHLFLLTDLVADWGSGPPANYFTFIPFQYLLNIDFTDFKLYLNTNDSNIINNPSELEENNFVILFGQRLHGDVHIPLDKFRPSQNEIQFDVKGQQLGLEVCMPPKNTIHTWVHSNKVAQLAGLTLSGSYTLMTETSAMNTDRLFMDIRGDKLYLELYGWLVHHFLQIKENYFGDDLHFRTLEEFQGLQSHSLAMDTTTPNGQPPKVSNDLDVILSVSAENASILLPANLYSAEAGLRAELPFAHCDLRFTNYYMDLLVNFSPISLSVGSDVTSPGLPHDAGGQTEVFIDSLTIAGHRLFGLPPTEPTYVCNWDFDVGTVSGECTPNFLSKAAKSINCFVFSLDDDENTLLITDPLIIHDSTFLRLRTHDIRVWLHVDKQVVLVSTGPVKLDFNDLAGDTFSRRLSAWIPNLCVSAIDERAALRYGSRGRDTQNVKAQAFLETTVSFSMFNRKLDFSEERRKQHTHILEHDQRTNRAQFMYMNHATNQLSANQEVRPPAMQFPEIPQPIFLDRPGGSVSDASSGYSSESASSGRRSMRTRSLASSSSGSFVNSIRSVRKHPESTVTQSSSRSRTLRGSPARANSSNGHRTHHDAKERVPGGLPSSVVLASPLAAPTSSLDLIYVDNSEVPAFPDLPPRPRVGREEAIQFNDVSTKHFDESFEHTSLIIEAEPGVRLYCTPEFVRCISGLVSSLQPCEPQDLLDDFQISAMTGILDRQKRREGKGKSIEFNVRIPWTHIRFQNAFGPNLGTQAGIDQYDVILNRLQVAARDKKLVGERTGESSISAHTTLGSLGISVTERKLDGTGDDVAVQAEVNDLLVWMLQNKETHVHVNSKAFEAATASRKIDYIASLIHRSTILGQELATRFVSINDTQKSRLRYLALRLTTAQEELQDPAFLTKASFALRAVRNHLRSHDSWKIISRFRYIWQTLSEPQKRRIRDHCTVNSVRCPADAEERIVSMWDRWRTWDLAHVNKSLAMKMLFGSAIMEHPEQAAPSPVYIDIRSAGIKAILDPGATQSEVALRILAISIGLIPPAEPAGLMLVGSEIPKRTTVVQINSGETAVRIHWEICELMDVLINMFEKENLKRSRALEAQSSCPPDGKMQEVETSLQFVYVTERATIALDTINLRNLLIGRRFRLSMVNEDSHPSKQGITTTVIVHLEQAVTELLSRSRLLLRSQFDSPSIYLSHHQFTERDAVPDEIKVAGASRKIEVRLEENVLGLLEVADSVLRDEVAYFHEQAMLIKRSLRPKLERTDRPKVTQLPNISLALLMDRYAIHLALLESLSWSITGSAGRVSVVPSIGGKNVTLRMDYDLAACHHRMFSKTAEASNLISSLEFPPVNGRLTVTNTESQTKISAAGIIETIQLQAAEVQALVATINKPEISTVVRAVSEDIEVLTARFREIIPHSNHTPVIKTPESSREIVFGVQMTLSGISVLASAPGQHPDSPMANLEVRLSSIQLRATNTGRDAAILPLPEAIVLLQEISVDLTLSDKNSIRRCGNIMFAAVLEVTAEQNAQPPRRVYRLKSSGLAVNIFADTASAVVDVMNHLQDKIKDLDLSVEKKYLKKLRHAKSKNSHKADSSAMSATDTDAQSVGSGALFTSTYSLELLDIYVSWIVGNSIEPYSKTESEDLVLSFRRINLSTRKDDAARLTIEDMQLQMVPVSASKTDRSANSALLPEVVFNVAYGSTKDTRKVAFHAAGKSLHLQLDSRFILPANVIERSIALAGKKFRAASANWSMTPTTDGAQRKNPFGNKRLASLSVDASFAGAVVHINGSDTPHTSNSTGKESKSQHQGRYSQFVGDASKSSLVLRAPGIALKVENEDDGQDPTLKAEIRIDASSNTLFPTVVPVIIEMSESIKEVVREKDEDSPLSPAASKPPNDTKPGVKPSEEDNLISVDPSTILGRKRLNLGVRICKQEFSLSCQPIARVAAIAKLEDIYITVNSVKSQDHGHFFAASAAFEKLEATVQHVYSRESTFGFNVDSIILSMMNSKHLSGTSGISAILKINPTALQINARQLQDFLLFREIWVPPEIRRSSSPAPATSNQEPQEYLMQRYQQVTAATAFPWNANVAIADVSVDIDLGQTIGKSSLRIQNMWASSRKGVDWEQNLCVGIEKIGIESTGRTSGFVDLASVKIRTSISWPSQDLGSRQTPLIQASVGFGQLQVKAGFDYQAFLIVYIVNFDFLMYNVREHRRGKRDRLVAILDGDKAHVLCTATSAAQGLALWQAIERLIQENQQAYKQSLKDIEKFLRRKSSVAAPYARSASQSMIAPKPDTDAAKTPISLHTDVVVTLRSISLGIFPSTFVDTQILHLEAADAQARFAVALEEGKIHSTLGMTLGQLSVALSSVQAPKKVKPVGELTVEDIVSAAKSAKGGTILRVPKVIATMHTWQAPGSNHIDYVFKSSLEGKVDVGWNYSRISFIRSMWGNHTRTLASRLGKPLPEPNIKITSSQAQPAASSATGQNSSSTTHAPDAKDAQAQTAQAQGQEKITAVVNVPQSRYEYTALEPPLIETPQLRDMGEATPPLEWIGLHRDRLPNVTHQIVIVALLEVAREVEEAYERILGSS